MIIYVEIIVIVGVYCNANQKCQLGQLVRGGSRTTQYWVVRSTQYQLESQWSSVELPGLQTHTNTDTSNFTIYTLAVILIRRCDVGSYQRSLVEWDVKYNWISLVLTTLSHWSPSYSISAVQEPGGSMTLGTWVWIFGDISFLMGFFYPKVC